MIGLAEKGEGSQKPPRDKETTHQIVLNRTSELIPRGLLRGKGASQNQIEIPPEVEDSLEACRSKAETRLCGAAGSFNAVRKTFHNSLPSSLSGSLQSELVGGEILHLLKCTAHDLRGALVSIGAGLKLMEKGSYGPMDQGVSSEVGRLRSDVASLMGILEDTLGRAFSLSEGVVHGMKEVNLRADVLDPVLAELANEINRRKAVFHNGVESIPSEMLTLQGDSFWLKVIFRNLLRNALKYGGQGVQLSAGLRFRNDVFIVNIFNSGQSIPEEHRPYLFERMKSFRSHGSEKVHGLGLGLWLVKQAVMKHGGEILYQPRGDGSNFIFTLPRHSAREAGAR
ncbi:MAG: sensor histidine kinase [Desulfobacteraceae bacterium]|jgi:signal transduction histidine kinase|nr:MAG: sensor histidine kinase [Desulfobacteraceae bacterium]